MSGAIFDLTGSYQAAFLNGIGFNLLNIGIVLFLLKRARASGRGLGSRGAQGAGMVNTVSTPV
jgi:hypothetical protein